MNANRKRFDWQKIHAELDERMARLNSTIDDDPERVHAVLKARSEALASLADREGGDDARARLLVFRLGEERYALPLDDAREVIGLPHAATIPGTGAAVLGIINWRGEFVVVFALAQLLGHVPDDDSRNQQVIVLRGENPAIAIAVDAVEKLIRVDLSTLQGPEQLPSKHENLFRGTTADAVPVLAGNVLRPRLTEELKTP